MDVRKYYIFNLDTRNHNLVFHRDCIVNATVVPNLSASTNTFMENIKINNMPVWTFDSVNFVRSTFRNKSFGKRGLEKKNWVITIWSK